ncbi:MAG: homoserine O-succinyltransferase [Acidobacteria bacterium]|nr:homoserine O-succinyltransferase [Acidobacteriota bacterium]
MIESSEKSAMTFPLRIACINIMPEAHVYEAFLVSSLKRAGYTLSPVWIRLARHAYRSTPPDHLSEHYVSFGEALAKGPVDGLILTGAPVETFPFSAVTYWPELSEILMFAKENIPGTLGLCWGGIALGKLMGLDINVYEKKLFGVFEGQSVHPDISFGGENGEFHCPHSRFAGISPASLRSVTENGSVRILATGPETGDFIFESGDRRFISHLGHPEYPPSRLIREWNRDREKGHSGVAPPAHFNPEKPKNTWELHTEAFFSYWLNYLTKNRAADTANRGKK